MNDEIKLRAIEVFFEKEGRLPIRIPKNKRIDGDKEQEHENSLGSWINNRKFDNSSLTEDQADRLSALLPNEKKKTSSEILLEVEVFINKHSKLPSKSATKRKKGIEAELKEEARLGAWITKHKAKNFINLTSDEKTKIQSLIKSCKTTKKDVKSSNNR